MNQACYNTHNKPESVKSSEGPEISNDTHFRPREKQAGTRGREHRRVCCASHPASPSKRECVCVWITLCVAGGGRAGGGLYVRNIICNPLQALGPMQFSIIFSRTVRAAVHILSCLRVCCCGYDCVTRTIESLAFLLRNFPTRTG